MVEILCAISHTFAYLGLARFVILTKEKAIRIEKGRSVELYFSPNFWLGIFVKGYLVFHRFNGDALTVLN